MWEINTESSLTFDGEEVSIDSVLKALEQDSGREIRAALPHLRFAGTNPVKAAIEIFGKFPSELKFNLGVIKNNIFYPSELNKDHLVLGDAWHPIDAISAQKINEFIERDDLSNGIIPSNTYFELLTDSQLDGLIRVSKEKTLFEDWKRIESYLTPPEGLEATLYEHQKAGSSRMRKLAHGNLGCLLGDEMGLGKTIQIITLVLDLPPQSQTLVIAPVSLLLNWKKEFDRFAPNIRSLIHAGPRRAGITSELSNYDVVITSYETLVNDLAFLDNIFWDLVVLDEAHQIRNPDAKRSVAVKSLNRRLSIAVTGTPVQNTLGDLWSVSEFVLPSLLGTKGSFEESFPDEETAADRLGQVIAPIVIRRRVRDEDVAVDLPPLVQFVTPLALDDLMREEYEILKVSGTAFETDVKLRVLCSHAGKIDTEYLDSQKFQRVLEMIEEIFAQNEKVLIFASYRLAISRLLDAIQARHPHSYTGVIQGDVPNDERDQIIEELTNHHGPGCLILNPAAGGVGLNIQSANHVIHFNPEYNPQSVNQATSRAHRIGQTKTVFVHHLYYEDTVEEKAMSIQDAKESLAEGVDRGIKRKKSRRSDTLTKQLSANDVGSTGSHQAGILIPKTELDFFPSLDAKMENPSCEIKVKIDGCEESFNIRFVYYNQKTRDEYRITRIARIFQRLEAEVGDTLTFKWINNDEILLGIEKFSLEESRNQLSKESGGK